MRLDVDRTLKVLLTIVMAAAIGYVGWQILLRVLYPIMLLLMGAIVAFILNPLVKRLRRAGMPKPLAILLVYVALLAVLSLLGYLLINPLVTQIQDAATALPRKVKDLQPSVNQRLNELNTWLKGHGFKTLNDLQSNAASYLSDVGNTAVKDWLPTVVTTSFSVLVDVVLTLVIAFYLLLDGERLKEQMYMLVPISQLSRVAFVEATVNEVLGGYLRGQLLMGLTIGTMAGVGTGLLGVPYPAVIGVLAAILELVPMLGPWLSSMPAAAITLVSGNPWPLFLWVVIYFVIIQQLESNVIGPRITGHAVGLHPLGALMALLVGIELDGIVGALFAVPVAGMLYVLGMAIYFNQTGRPQPVPVRSAARRSAIAPWLRIPRAKGLRVPSGEPEETGAEGTYGSRLRRLALGDVPERLANVEHARDALLEPILHQRQKVRDEAEARQSEGGAGKAATGPAEREEGREAEEGARTRPR